MPAYSAHQSGAPCRQGWSSNFPWAAVRLCIKAAPLPLNIAHAVLIFAAGCSHRLTFMKSCGAAGAGVPTRHRKQECSLSGLYFHCARLEEGVWQASFPACLLWCIREVKLCRELEHQGGYLVSSVAAEYMRKQRGNPSYFSSGWLLRSFNLYISPNIANL